MIYRCFAITVGLFISMAARADVVPAPLRIAVSSGVQGQFAQVTCGGAPDSVLTTIAAQLAGESDALAFDAGDFIGAAAVSQMIARHDPAGLAVAVQSMGYRAIAIGHHDLSADRTAVVALVRAIAARHIPFVLSNLRCDAAHRDLCDSLGAGPVIVDDVGFVHMVSPSWLDSMSTTARAGLTLEPLAAAIPRALAAARAAGASQVVLSLDPGRDHELDETLVIANGFAAGPAPDVFLVAQLPDGIASIDTSAARVPVAVARPAGVVLVEPGAARVARPARTGSVPAGVAGYAAATRDWLCADQARPLAGAALSEPMDRDDFASLYLDVLRELAHAELAVINRKAIRAPNGLFPIRAAITPLTMAAALPYDDSLQVAWVRGSALKTFVTAHRATDFYVRGVTSDKGNVTVNGRQLEEEQEYRLVTTGYVAAGGSGGIAANVHFHRFGDRSAQERFLTWLAVPRLGNPRSALPDPADNARWYLRLTLDGSFASTDIKNPNSARFDDSQLNRAEAANLKLDAQFAATADHPWLRFDNLFRIEYGLARTAVADFAESRDLVSNRANLTFRPYGRERRWFQPLPDAEFFLETEFSRAADLPQPHHLLLRPSAGLRFDLTSRLFFRIGFGLEVPELLADNVDPQGVLLARGGLLPGRIFTLGERDISASLTIDVAVREPWRNTDAILRASAQLSMTLLAPISVTLGYDLFARIRDSADATGAGVAVGIAADATVGLKVVLDRSISRL